MDRYVIDIPWLLRFILVNILIVPRRKFASAELYKKIWTERGSPLMTNTIDLADAVRSKAGDRFSVAVGMRYGRPSLISALERFASEGLDEVVVFPLYPQYAESTTRSVQEACERWTRKHAPGLKLKFVAPFYDDERFIGGFARLVQEKFAESGKPEHLLMSFHGLPERQVRRTDRSGGQHCLVKSGCCDSITEANRDCYRAQCFATARALGKALELSRNEYSVAFQSRLGRTPWIKPYTDEVIRDRAVAQNGSLAVVCPSFVADCLETLEEIGEQAAETYVGAGGGPFTAIACLNTRPDWVETVIALSEQA
jgi:ferrochelatase